jgi:N-acetylneuraminic acid mutarotase
MRIISITIIGLFFSAIALSQTWTKKTDFINGYSSSAFAFTINDTIYVGNSGGTGLYKYNAAADAWTTLNNLPATFNNRSGSFSFVIGNKAYVMGGVNGSGVCVNDLWEYNPATDSWTQKAGFPGGKRSAGTSFVIGSYAYIAGGIDTIDIAYPSLPKNDFWRYDAATDSWQQKANLPYDSSYLYQPFGFSLNGKGYISCGEKYRLIGTVYDFSDEWKTYEYDTTSNTWTQKANFPGAPRSGGVSFVLHNKAYCGTGGGNDYSTGFDDFYKYDPALDKWDSVNAAITGPRAFAVAATLSTGVAYVGTGWNPPGTTTYYQDWWEFTPPTSVPGISSKQYQLSCYPQPCVNELFVTIPDNIHVKGYSVINLLGEEVQRGNTLKNRINTGLLPGGTYVLIVYTDKGVFRQMFVKTNY